MPNEYIIRILKYGVITFVILVITIIIISYNYDVKGLASMSLGQDWYMVFEFRKKNNSFIIDFGYLSVIIPIVMAIVSDFVLRLATRRRGKLRASKVN
ncbi:hypothetical protein CFB3_45090 [Clostridium folliculivorans]|uniref:Uncharacterized protein n=1 Tax=Clostridium folliculivorans TaxID=2886038 RepID=A0A9W5Y6Y9_9CLOT|nr:hypothetical protein CFOLD11_44650 [Clostridium folliculivorans]GKU32401.1 hypothetical protein CFB3_45090 [Clostridium folliculivorans]